MSIVVVAEKPSVARDIAKVLGANGRGDSCLVGSGYVVTWAIGHLVSIAEPHEMNPIYKAWRWDRLPILPNEWRLKVLEKTADHFEKIKTILTANDVTGIVCATDAGREGELIFRYIQDVAGATAPVKRLWISSLTPEAIKDGFTNLRPASEYDALGMAAVARARADWLVGMNLSRAYSLRFGPGLLSVGRVQTPTLAMIVDREKVIRDFVAEVYFEVKATFGTADGDRYEGTWFDPAKGDDDDRSADRLPQDGALANEIVQRVQGGTGAVASLSGTDKRHLPPLLYDLSELQRDANRLYGLTAKDTLTAAQSLYERHKLLTYPRTDSRHLSSDIAKKLGPVVDAIAGRYPNAIAPGSGRTPLSARFVDDSKVTDHHAIIPTPVSANGKALGVDESQVYDLVCRRFLMAWHDDHLTRVTVVMTTVTSEDTVDRFKSSGTVVTQVGWKILSAKGARKAKTSKKGDGEEGQPNLPDGLAPGQQRPVSAVSALRKETTPPKRFTDASLLTAMETAGKMLDDRELESAMKERGLGTPATRAAILETLILRNYIERKGKSLAATDAGIALIDAVHDKVKSPAMTGEWELRLKNMERGNGTIDAFMADIEAFVIEVLGLVRSAGRDSSTGTRTAGQSSQNRSAEVTVGTEGGRNARDGRSAEPANPDAQPATLGEQLLGILRQRFGHNSFRPHQEEVCAAVAKGDDALLVMPTGSGKSLCYQLPGIARGGTTLVISPLIALMEDQVSKLQALGFKAERIHSGRTREQSRDASKQYLAGVLDFLMIAPERLSVPGFPEMLAKRKPTLIAIDEAHCISHWGHDFRPDYRLLGDRLPLLRPSPIIAMTATATVRVQDDICDQLGMPKSRRFIRGFRRDNLAIEAASRLPSERLDEVLRILADPQRRPAIVYVPSRKMAEDVAEKLSAVVPTLPYHAGQRPDRRSATQEAFIEGRVEVITATIAFGMGVDKADIRTVIHMAMPGSVEAYYQEIGRAGRDGKTSRALLFYSYSDRKVHESFFNQNYPPTKTLSAIRNMVPNQGIDREALIATCGFEPEIAENAVAKLWIHGGLAVDSDDRVTRGDGDYLPSYETIRDHRMGQIDDVMDLVRSGDCRMTRLVRHFGESATVACGLCDNCKPDQCLTRTFRAASTSEREIMNQIMLELANMDGAATGSIYKRVAPEGRPERSTFERLVSALARSGLITISEDSFESDDGRSVRFRRVHRTNEAVRRVGLGDWEVSLEEHTEKAATTRIPKGGTLKKREAIVEPDKTAFDYMRAWRLDIAKAEGIPAFRILPDKSLKALTSSNATTLDDMGRISGIGPHFLDKYGRDALLALARARDLIKNDR